MAGEEREEPKYEHDCESCVFLGCYSVSGQDYDLYFCMQGSFGMPTVIARFSNYGPDYVSGLVPAALTAYPALLEATRRALIKFYNAGLGKRGNDMEMRHMSEADKIWFRQEIRGAARQVIYEEFGEVLQFFRAVKDKRDMDAVAEVVEAGDPDSDTPRGYPESH